MFFVVFSALPVAVVATWSTTRLLHGDCYKLKKVFALLRMEIRYTLNLFNTLNQGYPNSCPRAKSGPRKDFQTTFWNFEIWQSCIILAKCQLLLEYLEFRGGVQPAKKYIICQSGPRNVKHSSIWSASKNIWASLL